jgi:hypothetical protein
MKYAGAHQTDFTARGCSKAAAHLPRKWCIQRDGGGSYAPVVSSDLDDIAVLGDTGDWDTVEGLHAAEGRATASRSMEGKPAARAAAAARPAWMLTLLPVRSHRLIVARAPLSQAGAGAGSAEMTAFHFWLWQVMTRSLVPHSLYGAAKDKPHLLARQGMFCATGVVQTLCLTFLAKRGLTESSGALALPTVQALPGPYAS